MSILDFLKPTNYKRPQYRPGMGKILDDENNELDLTEILKNIVNEAVDAIQVNILNSNGEIVSIQNPLPSNGDSVYCKDVWVEQSDVSDWTDEDSTGISIACIPFTNLHTRIKNSTANNPKELLIHFNRTVFATQVGLGCVGSGENFSNVRITALGSGGVERVIKDESSSDIKYTSRNYFFSKQELFNAIKFEFLTEDAICLSNITIQKVSEVSISQVERTTNSLKVIDYSHAELHSGAHYFARSWITLGNSESAELLIVTPDTERWAHMIFQGSGEDGEILAEIYEDAVTSDDGVRDNERNRNRNFPDDNTTFVYRGPVVSNLGTLLADNVFGSGKSSGGGGRDAEEILLKQNTKYIFRVTNNTVSANKINWTLDWYEHTNVGEPEP